MSLIKKIREFYFEGGIIEYIKFLNKNKNSIHQDPIYLSNDKTKNSNNIKIECSLEWTNSYHENMLCFTFLRLFLPFFIQREAMGFFNLFLPTLRSKSKWFLLDKKNSQNAFEMKGYLLKLY